MRIRRTYLLFLMIISSAPDAWNQVESAPGINDDPSPPFNLDAVNFSAGENSEQSRLDVYVQVPYSRLGFVQVGETYSASYELSIVLFDSSGRSFSEKGLKEEIEDVTFDESVSPTAYNLVRRVVEAPPGRYKLVAVVRDLDIRESLRVSQEVVLTDFSSSSFSLSGIMLLSRLSKEEGRKNIVPNVSPNVGLLVGGFHAFLEAYNWNSLDSIRVVTEVVDESGEQVFLEKGTQKLLPGRNQLFVRVDNTTLSMGDYVLRVHAYRTGTDSLSEELATTEKQFVVRWKGMPLTSKDLDAAIEQLQYIDDAGEMDYINAAETDEEKRDRFMEFWKKRDPTPSTLRNEKMEEYYSRIQYANKHFAHYIEGWRTDMGMVYVVFGAPNNVDRHPFDIDSKPYEVWSYYELNHQFTFVDETGFGDYRLTTPIWEVWQRPR